MILTKPWTHEYRRFLKTLLFLTIPIVLQEFLNALVNVIDSFMIGQLGENEINAVGFSNELFFLYVVFIFGITSGCSIFMGQFWGKRDTKNIRKVIGICFIFSLLLSLVFATVAFVFPERFISFYSMKPEVIALGAQYLRVLGASYLVTSLTVTFNAALRCIGQTKIPMCTTIVALLTNAALNYLFIFVFGWGVVGAALATAIARCAELIAQCYIIFAYKLPIAAKIKQYFSFDKQFLKTIGLAIVPVFLNEAVWAVGMTLYNVAYRATGNEAQAAVQISAAVQRLFMVIGFGIGAGSGIMIANTLGMGERADAQKHAWRCLALSVAVSVLMGACLVLFAPFILSSYNVSDVVKDSAFKIMCVIAVAMAFKTFNYTAIVGILRNGGDTKFCLLLDAGCAWLIGVPAAFLGAQVFHLPIYVIVALVSCEELAKFFFTFWRIRLSKWVKCVV
ncbi:MAG: MATE family efflux transporter [Clostridiales bacterium]|jgi:putative MATE family efflux protein|nr:MATE family efflux transporter [Clostridiales bacterium]